MQTLANIVTENLRAIGLPQHPIYEEVLTHAVSVAPVMNCRRPDDGTSLSFDPIGVVWSFSDMSTNSSRRVKGNDCGLLRFDCARGRWQLGLPIR